MRKRFGVLKSHYHITDTLHENASTVVYRVRRISDGESLIVKMLKSGETTEHRISQFMNEQQLLSMLRSPRIARLVDVIASPSAYVHVFEDIGGSSLYDLLLVQRFSLSEGLGIALKIAETLQYLHQKHIIHADVNPKNIIYNPQTQALQIIDFGYSILDNHFRYNSERDVGTSGNLMYMSPEQTGKTKQRIDYRSDLYSFGMTLYHLFSGRAPFEAKDRYELIHKQVALHPVPLEQLEEGFPAVLGMIVRKLIEKTPDKRYQSNEALIHDLKLSLQNLSGEGTIAPFCIGSYDRPNVSVGEHLFGREREVELLREAAEKVFSHGGVRLVVSGHSGVGKSRLTEEFLTYLSSSGSRILRGKFEEYKLSQPYLTFRQLFTQLGGMLMRQGKAQHRIRMESRSAEALCSVFPELRGVLPAAPTPDRGEELYPRLPYAIGELFAQVATETSPLVIFLDDLQWGDDASIDLIEKTLLQVPNPYVHLLLSYRNTEIGANPRASALIEKIQAHPYGAHYRLELNDLSEEALGRMLGSLLGEHTPHIASLATFFYKKTAGNPFYVKTLLQTLIEGEKLVYDHGKWVFETESLRRYGAGDNIAALIHTRLSQLDEKTAGFLRHLSLLGSRFDLELAREVMHALGHERGMLDRLEAQGFVEFYGGEYQFVHDLILHHLVDSMDPQERQKAHSTIARVLWRGYEEGRYDHVAGVVSHFKQGEENAKPDRRWFLLNLKALETMVQSGTYPLALEHLRWIEARSGVQTPGIRESERFEYGVVKTKILYLNALHAEARDAIGELMARSRTVAQRQVCFTLYKNLCVTRGEGFAELLDFGNSLLGDLGLTPPDSPEAVAAEVVRLRDFVARHPIGEDAGAVMTLPRLRNGSKERIVSMLVDYWEGAYYLADIPLMEWAYMSIVEHSFRYGNTSASSFGYVLYGARMVSERHYAKGYRFARTALKLNALFGDESMLPKLYNFMANFISPYTRGFGENIALYRRSLQQSRVNGDIVFGTWANFLMHMSEYLWGHSLDALQENIDRESLFLLGSGDQKMIAIFDVLRSVISDWQEKNGENGEEHSSIELWEREEFYPGLAWYAILKAQTCWIEGKHEEGLEYLRRYLRTSANEVIMFPKIRLHPLRALLLLGKGGELDAAERSILEEDLAECAAYAKASPAHFRFWKLLIAAEQARGTTEYWEVAKRYDHALREARKQGNPFYVAAAGVCAGRFWEMLRFADLSRFYFSEAAVGLNQWGAYAAASRLKSRMALPSVSQREEEQGGSSSSSLLKAEPTNYRSLLKSFYALSQVTEKRELLQSLMQIILENATASKAVLILREEEEFHAVAGIHFATGKIELMNVRLSEAPFLPYHLISHAIDVHHKISVTHPAQSGRFQFDEYFRHADPASCIAIPASVDGSVRGVLYLENDEIATPLDVDALQTLRLLLTQAAIVYQKALLYETLREREESLTKAQQISHVGSWHYDHANGEVSWSAETYRIYEIDPFSVPADGDWMMNHVHPADAQAVMEAKERVLGGQPFCEVVNRIITAKGNVRTVRQRAEVYWENDHQKVSGTLQDITESRRAQEMIDRLSQVVSQTPFATIITDQNGVIEYVNNHTLGMTGYFRNELIGQKMSLFKSGHQTAEFYGELWDTILRRRSIWRGTIVNRMKNGALRDIASTIFPVFGPQNEIESFVTIQDDVTERKMKDRLFLMQTRQAQMGEMLSMIAHQWRQPLAIMSALMNRQKINILLEQATLEEISRSFDEIEVQLQHLSRTITDFKDFFKPGKQTVMTRSSTIVSKSLELIEHALMMKNIRVEKVHLNDGEYQTFENEMVQVMLNLIKNAMDAFEERGVKDARLLIRTDQQGGDVHIRVEDNAGGIPPEIIGTLFTPYVSTKSERHGTGLGLYMSKLVVEEHCQGKIEAQNTAQGARFSLRFPIRITVLP